MKPRSRAKNGRRPTGPPGAAPAPARVRSAAERVYAHDRVSDQSDAGSAGIFLRRTNQTQDAP
eukprot:1179821-Prorocentrum_minimum.AAC.3